jgi:hypothetical protein
MWKPVYPCAYALVVLSLLGLMGCYSSVTVDSSDEKAIAIDWVDPPCAEPGSPAGYIEGNGFGAENVTITVGGIEAEVLAATGKDASFVVPDEIEPGQSIEVVVMNPGGRLATIQWVACGCPGFACTEQGIREAIAVGGGPHTFCCDGPTTVVTQAEIVIDNDVILDGEGNLTVDGNDDHRVLSVEPGITAELVGMTITRGLAVVSDMGSGIYNRGTLTLIDSTVSFNRDQIPEDAAPIHSKGTLVLINSRVSDNASSQSGSILCTGSTTLINSTVSENDGGDISGIEYYGDGFLHVINSTVIGSPRGDQGGAIGNGGFGQPFDVMEVRVSNSILVSRNSEPTCVRSDGLWTSGGGNIEVPGDTCDFTDSTDLVNVTEAELNLGLLADNGGPTMTHALLPGSVAIDRIPKAMCVDADGLPLMTDQRGLPRPVAILGPEPMCDVGAFEVQP